MGTVTLRAVWMVALALLFGSSATSSAQQQKGTGTTAAKCACLCEGAGITTPTVVTDIDSKGLSCSSFKNQVCTVDDPATGGVRTGKTSMCAAQGAAPPA